MLQSRLAIHAAVAATLTIGASAATLLGLRLPPIAYIAALFSGASAVEVAQYARGGSGRREGVSTEELNKIVQEAARTAIEEAQPGQIEALFRELQSLAVDPVAVTTSASPVEEADSTEGDFYVQNLDPARERDEPTSPAPDNRGLGRGGVEELLSTLSSDQEWWNTQGDRPSNQANGSSASLADYWGGPGGDG